MTEQDGEKLREMFEEYRRRYLKKKAAEESQGDEKRTRLEDIEEEVGQVVEEHEAWSEIIKRRSTEHDRKK